MVTCGGHDARCGGKDLMQSLGANLHVPDWQVEGKRPMEINSLDTWTAAVLHTKISTEVDIVNISNGLMRRNAR